MKTTHTFTTNNKTNIKARVRSILTIVGIVTAIIWSVILFQQSDTMDHAEASIPDLIDASDFINTEMLANAGTTIWSMR
jgi:hypothetical protein